MLIKDMDVAFEDDAETSPDHEWLLWKWALELPWISESGKDGICACVNEKRGNWRCSRPKGKKR